MSLANCRICPRACGADRSKSRGFCGAAEEVKVAKAFLHQWEEPCISGEKGSGTIFFSGCTLKCIFCQNHHISQEHYGKEVSISRLSEIMLELQHKGAANINLVTPTSYVLHIIDAVAGAKKKGLSIPIVYNTNGYETENSIELLKGTVDIYLPDIKYYSERNSQKYSGISDYFEKTSRAVLAMVKQAGFPVFDERGLMQKGVLIRHLVLPDMLEDSKRILRWIEESLGQEAYVSLMCQYVPMYKAAEHEEINRRLEEWEYEYIIDYFFKIGLQNGFIQDYSSATEEYVPDFNLDGV